MQPSPSECEPTIHGRLSFWKGTGLFLIAFAMFFAACQFWSDEPNDSPPGSGKDDVFYESIAMSLVRGEGYCLDFTNEEFLAPYRQFNEGGKYDWIFQIEAEGPTTSRAPGFPLYMAAIYKCFGRNWSTVRFGNAIFLSFGLTILVCTVYRNFGLLTASLATVLLCLDFKVLGTANRIMSEALATGMLCITFSILIWAWNSRQRNASFPWPWALVGICFGMTLMVRSTLVAWIMQLLVLVGCLAIIFLITKRGPAALLRGAVLFFVATFVVAMPWWVRNCQVSGQFAPFGCAGDLGWVGGLSDETVEKFGNWHGPNLVAIEADWVKTHDPNDYTLAEIEYSMGQQSKAVAKEWVFNNLSKMPWLMTMKALNHLSVICQPVWIIGINVALLAGVVVGSLFSWRRFGFWILLVVFMSVATTMLTWSHFGRFAIPMRPLWQVASAVAIVLFWKRVLSGKQSESSSPSRLH